MAFAVPTGRPAALVRFSTGLPYVNEPILIPFFSAADRWGLLSCGVRTSIYIVLQGSTVYSITDFFHRTVCWPGGGCCPDGKICSGPPPPPPPPPITVGDPGDTTLTETTTGISSPPDVTLTNTILTPATSPVVVTTVSTSPIVPTFSSPIVTTSLAVPNLQSRASMLLPGWIHLMALCVSFPLIMAVLYI
jgi:hypothetical protein